MTAGIRRFGSERRDSGTARSALITAERDDYSPALSRSGGRGTITGPSRSDRMKTKAEIVLDWLPRYTGRPVEQFGRYILLTNFAHYVELFAAKYGVEVLGRDRPMLSAAAEEITIMDVGIGSTM